MINGLLTMRGAWHRVAKEPILKFFVAALTFYGMATFEGPLLSIKSVNALAHFTDWIIGHVHSGVLGWNGFMIMAMAYYLVPRLWKTKLYSERLANWHFWTATVGILLYILSMWVAGITQGLMWRGVVDGRLLYPDFMETVLAILPMYGVRALGGTLYLIGYILGLYNIYRTIRSAPKSTGDETVLVQPLAPFHHDANKEHPHRFLEGSADLFIVLSVIAVLVGSVIEILPTLVAHQYVTVPESKKPYSALALAGRDIYIREGCYTCHSQMVRPMVSDVLRYGAVSTPEDTVYDHPFQWGSKRTGPDLARVGGKYPDSWHYHHMRDPRAVTPKSIMPGYPWLVKDRVDYAILEKKLAVMKIVGVPYTEKDIATAVQQARAESEEIANRLAAQGVPNATDREITALIAYLQSLRAIDAETSSEK